MFDRNCFPSSTGTALPIFLSIRTPSSSCTRWTRPGIPQGDAEPEEKMILPRIGIDHWRSGGIGPGGESPGSFSVPLPLPPPVISSSVRGCSWKRKPCACGIDPGHPPLTPVNEAGVAGFLSSRRPGPARRCPRAFPERRRPGVSFSWFEGAVAYAAGASLTPW
jgi:hypothetical protein